MSPSLNFKTSWIFISILLIIALTGLYPSPTTIGLAMFVGGALIVYQVIMVLKDDSGQEESWPDDQMYRDRVKKPYS